MQTPIVIKQGTNPGQIAMQSGMVTVPITVTSSMAGTMPNVMTINKTGGQNVVVTTQNLGSGQPAIIPNVQILNMRPGTAGPVSAQKSVATVSPRVVIGSQQVVGARTTTPGITLQTLQSLQQQGQQSHLLLKTENGQYQLLRVGPAPATGTIAAPQPQTLRLSTVPAHAVSTTVPTSNPSLLQMPGQMPPAPVATPVIPSPVTFVESPVSQQMQSTATIQKPLDNTKEKCRKFLANLLDLSSKEPQSVERSVKNLIQELIDAQVESEEFCDRLEKLLNASPQPCLIGFLKKSLPLLRQSLVTKELVIEGITPPSVHVAFPTILAPAPQAVIASSNIQMPYDDEDSNPTLTTLLPPVMPMSLPPPQKSYKIVQANTKVIQPYDEEDSNPTLTTLLPPEMSMSLPPPQQKSYKIQPAHTKNIQPKPQKSGALAVLQNIPLNTKVHVTKIGKTVTLNSKASSARSGSSTAALSTVLSSGRSLLKEKDKKSSIQYSLPFGDDKMTADDDINDVAAMGGVNLAEESQRILGSTEHIGTQIRSCKDEYLTPLGLMQARIRVVTAKYDLEEPSVEVASLICHALHERLKNIIEKLVLVARHKIDPTKNDFRYEITQNIKGQIKFLEEIESAQRKGNHKSQTEHLLRPEMSSLDPDDSEQTQLNYIAEDIEIVESEEPQERESKKPRLDGPGSAGDSTSSGCGQSSGDTFECVQQSTPTSLRVDFRDALFFLEQDRDYEHSTLLYRSYLK